MLEKATERLTAFLRWSEKYTKTDMVYLAGAGFWSTWSGVIVSVFALFMSVAFANWLPGDVYGTYQYLLSLSSLLAAICLSGMNSAIVQSVARGYEGDLRASVRFQLLWGIVPTLVGLGFAGYYFLHGNAVLAGGLLFIGLLTPVTSTFNTYAAFLQGKKEFRRSAYYAVAINLTYYLFMFPAVFFFKQALILIFVNLAANAVAVLYFYFRTLKVYQPNDRTDPQTISYGVHLSIMNVIGSVVAQLDNVLVFHFLGPIELAVYSFASLVPERIGSLLKFVTNAAIPKFSNQTHEEIQRHIVSKTLRAVIPGAAITVVYIAAAPFLFHIFFPKYADAIFFTQIYAAYIITVVANIPGAALVAMRLNPELYVFNVGTPLVLLALQVWLLLTFGIAGILLARVISNTLNIVLAAVLVLHPFLSKKSNI